MQASLRYGKRNTLNGEGLPSSFSGFKTLLSMKSLSLAAQKDKLDLVLNRILAIDPSLVVLFGAPSFFADTALCAQTLARLKSFPTIGCSTAGEISGTGVFKDSVVFLALRFDKTPVRTASEPLASSGDSFSAGQNLAASLQAPDLRAVLVFAPGTNVNGSALIEGIENRLGHDITIAGGLAADETFFKKTYTVCAEGPFTDRVVAVGLYGNAISVSCASEGGWRPFGPARRVTRVQDNVLYELDGKPALHLYKQYLGEKARALPASGLSYPFAVLREDRTTSGVIRSALAIDHEHGALILAGNVPAGGRVCLMHADTDALTQSAAQAATEALRTHAGPEDNGCALAISFIGRKGVYGIDPEEEIEAVAESFLPGTPIAGYYSYGEIATQPGKKKSAFHNQTMTIVYITENGETR